MNESNHTNDNSNYCEYYETKSDVEKTGQFLTLLILGGFGIFGNIFVIVLAVKYTVTKSLHFLIINMAVADALFVIINLFRYVIENVLEYSIWNDIDQNIAQILCKTLSFSLYVFAMESLVTLLIISIERYKITRQFVQISQTLSGKRRAAVVSGCWLISVVLNLHLLISTHIDKYNSETTCVYIQHQNQLRIVVIVECNILLVCYISIVVLSILTLRKISRPQAIEDSLSEVQRQQRRKRIRSAVKVVLYSCLLFCGCYLPFAISHF